MKSPTLQVLGLYSLTMNSDDCGRFINDKIASMDPANHSEGQKALFRRLGRDDCLQHLTPDQRTEMARDLHAHMNTATT